MTLLASPGDDDLGRRLAALRVAAALSQPALGALVGLTVRQVADVEHGRRLTDGRLIENWLSACAAVDHLDEVLDLLPEVQPYADL
jgi:transcriptional regulator with XRE-family HTH domain